MSWGKGWEVGIRREIWAQHKAQELAIAILETECGTRHVQGSHLLCPKCKRLGRASPPRTEEQSE